jgi:uncharacterized surface protein with fasciclin (FAS1) repeats
MSNITQVVNTDKNMTTLKKAVHSSGLDQILSSRGPFTFFAPSDLAFSKLDIGIVEELLQPENKLKLTSLLHQHTVEGKLSFADLKDGDKLKTVDGRELSVKVQDGIVTIDNATIQRHDVKTTNGVIHSLDTVLNN